MYWKRLSHKLECRYPEYEDFYNILQSGTLSIPNSLQVCTCFLPLWSSVYGYQHCDFFFPVNLETRNKICTKSTRRDKKKSSYWSDIIKQVSLECVKYFPSTKLFQNFGIWCIVEMIQTPSLSHGICLFTAY